MRRVPRARPKRSLASAMRGSSASTAPPISAGRGLVSWMASSCSGRSSTPTRSELPTARWRSPSRGLVGEGRDVGGDFDLGRRERDLDREYRSLARGLLYEEATAHPRRDRPADVET